MKAHTEMVKRHEETNERWFKTSSILVEEKMRVLWLFAVIAYYAVFLTLVCIAYLRMVEESR